MSNVFVRLIELYENHGYTVQSSLSPSHFPGFNLAEIPFTYIFRDNKQVCKGGGISLAEICFFEALFENYKPNSLFIIGNAFGWSTLALAILNPSSKVVAIDMCPRPAEREGIRVTNIIGEKVSADVVARIGTSPNDIEAIVTSEFSDKLDFVFIDGGHTNEQLLQDFQESQKFASEQCVYVFHDVINFKMTDAFINITENNNNFLSSFLFRTPSGMAITYSKKLAKTISPVVHCFTETEERQRALLNEGRYRATQLSNKTET